MESEEKYLQKYFNNICRTCLSEESINLQSVFDSELHQMIMTCASVQVKRISTLIKHSYNKNKVKLLPILIKVKVHSICCNILSVLILPLMLSEVKCCDF